MNDQRRIVGLPAFRSCTCVAVVEVRGAIEVLCGCVADLALAQGLAGSILADCADCLGGQHKNDENSLLWDTERSAPLLSLSVRTRKGRLS